MRPIAKKIDWVSFARRASALLTDYGVDYHMNIKLRRELAKAGVAYV
jgi:hypothetical protein